MVDASARPKFKRSHRLPMKKFAFLLAVLLAACQSQPVQNLSAQNPPAVEAAFSPRGGSLALILRTIGEAKNTIRVAAYTFTSQPVAEALLAAHKRGVDVRLVADAKGNQRYTAARFLANAGIPVRLNGRYPIHHNKFMVIDGKILETGSFNYSAQAANKNAENVLVLRNAPQIAAQYEKEWQRLWDEAQALEAAY